MTQPIQRPLSRLRAKCAALRSARSGVAFIEFAYSLPVFMALSISGVELANIAITHARVSNLTTLVADGAARVRDRIDEADINEIVLAAQQSGSSIDLTTHGRVIISSVVDNTATAGNTTDQLILWQRCKGLKSASGYSYGSEGAVLPGPIGAVGRTIAATERSPVIFAQIIYEYQPIISNNLFGAQTWHYQSAFIIRDRQFETMQNGKNLPAGSRALCSAFST